MRFFVSGNGPGISGARKAPDRMLGARSRPGAWRAARGSELSARRQPTCHGLATVNVIEITAFAKACRVSAFPPCGRLMLRVPIFGVGLPYGWASWPTWPRIDVRGRLFGGLRPLPILGYRGAVRPPMCVLVVGTVCNLGPACPGFFSSQQAPRAPADIRHCRTCRNCQCANQKSRAPNRAASTA